MKKDYIEPEVELIRLNVEDIVTASGGGGGLDEDELPWVFA